MLTPELSSHPSRSRTVIGNSSPVVDENEFCDTIKSLLFLHGSRNSQYSFFIGAETSLLATRRLCQRYVLYEHAALAVGVAVDVTVVSLSRVAYWKGFVSSIVVTISLRWWWKCWRVEIWRSLFNFFFPTHRQALPSTGEPSLFSCGWYAVEITLLRSSCSWCSVFFADQSRDVQFYMVRLSMFVDE
jgi:hypothetical protein